jgi:hypothetical protein
LRDVLAIELWPEQALAEYWDRFFESAARPGWKFMVEDPNSPAHDPMWIVTVTKAIEYRLFHLKDVSTDGVCEFPEREWRSACRSDSTLVGNCPAVPASGDARRLTAPSAPKASLTNVACRGRERIS